MFRFTTSAVVAVPTPLETGMTPIHPSNFAKVSETMTGKVKTPAMVRSRGMAASRGLLHDSNSISKQIQRLFCQ